jgi:hypothetical protein
VRTAGAVTQRAPERQSIDANCRTKVPTKESILWGEEELRLGAVEQLVEHGQTRFICEVYHTAPCHAIHTMLCCAVLCEVGRWGFLARGKIPAVRIGGVMLWAGAANGSRCRPALVHTGDIRRVISSAGTL